MSLCRLRAIRPRPGRAARGVCLALVVASSLGFLVGSFAARAAGTRSTGAVSTAGYLDRVEAARVLAEEGRRSPSPERMRQVRDRLGLPVTVTTAEGQRIGIASDPVLEDLEGDAAADFGRAADHLEELAAAAGRMEAAPGIDRGRIPGALRGAYRGIAAEPTIPQRVGAWLRLLVSRIWRFLTEGAEGGSLLWVLVRIAAVGAVGVLVVFVAVRLLRQVGLVPGRDRRVPPAGAERVDWARAADEALARGEAREAVRALYRALVEVLTERSLVPDLPSLTPAECRIAVRRRSAQHSPGRGQGEVDAETLMEAIDRATTAFERVVYGRGTASEADVEALREAGRAARAARAA
jgi:Domain of unknown function (DUF4129)